MCYNYINERNLCRKEPEMIELGFYERVVPMRSRAKNTVRKVGVAVACGLALIVWLFAALISGTGVVACLIVSLLIAAIPFVISSLTATELEYSISADSISLAMIYGGKRRKEVFWAEADDILLIAPNSAENQVKAEAYSPKQRFLAVSDAEDVNQWLVVFKDEKENNYLFTFEAEDGVQKLLKMLKPAAFSR